MVAKQLFNQTFCVCSSVSKCFMYPTSNITLYLHYSLSAYWLGASPQTFYKYYTVKAVVLYTARFYLYKAKNWHYYMLEFCYFANILLLLEVWVFPRSPTFHKVSHLPLSVFLFVQMTEYGSCIL